MTLSKRIGSILSRNSILNHSIAYGLNNLHEGINISHPVNKHKDFKIFAYNSKSEPMVFVC